MDLPYDVRVMVYAHLFPTARHVHLASFLDGLEYLPPARDAAIPLSLLLTCKEIHQETSEFLYNGYLFDVLGKKKDCLAHYKQLQETIEKYARDRVYVRALSNGPNSDTGCISMFVGDAKLAMLERRGRGKPTTLEDFAQEANSGYVQRLESRYRHRRYRGIVWARKFLLKSAIVVALFGILLAWFFAWKFGKTLSWCGVL